MSASSDDPVPRLVLGSGSPRRRELLAQIGVIPFDIRAPDIDETPEKSELPLPYVQRMARQKAEAVCLEDGEVALCADTAVFVGRRILGKPQDAAEAEQFLRLLSGRRHSVATSVVLRNGPHLHAKTTVTKVKLKSLSDREVAAYLATQDWRGKAGGYAIQGPAACFIPWIQGSYTGVVGLPLAETAALLATAGIYSQGAVL